MIINKLEENSVSLINYSKSNFFTDNKNNFDAIDEAESFIEYYKKKIQNIQFVKNTLKILAGYLIRRFYFPSDFFNNPSFFSFDENEEDSFENIFKKNYVNLLKSESNNENKIESFLFNTLNNCINTENIDHQNQYNIYTFYEDEFIDLRNIFQNKNFSYHLYFHKKKQYIFAIKLIYDQYENQYEKSFVEFHSHRCFTRFYGYLYKRNQMKKEIGLVYEFMSNGTLYNYSKKQSDLIWTFIAICRIFSAINYLHSNFLIHRDIKPDNILIDHNYKPFIADYETIRYTEDDKSIETNITQDNCVSDYASPEQNSGQKISFYSDIYSFGRIVGLLFKDLMNENNETSNIKEIYISCTRNDPDKRMKSEEIINKINNQFIIYNNLLIEQLSQRKIIQNTEYFFQNICFLSHLNEKEDGINNFLFAFFNADSRRNDIVSDEQISDILFTYFDNLYNGYFIKQNKENSLIYLKSSARLNNPKALFKLGFFYLNGILVNQDYTQAIKYIEQSSAHNFSESYFLLGTLYENGQGCKQSYLEALKYYELASKQNNSKALTNLGNLYAKGLGVKKDYLKAIKYYNLAIKQNNPIALLNLGIFYEYGYGVEQNYQKAESYFLLSAKQNNASAFFNLGLLCENQMNYRKAKKYYELAAEQNNSSALNHLGNFYLFGLDGEQNYTKAFDFYKKSIELNNPTAYHNLGFIYEKGCGPVPEADRAIYFYKLAIKKGYYPSYLSLGDIYYGKKDYLNAKENYKMAAKYNYQEALYKLGNLYYYGYGVEKNYQKAKKFYEQSARHYNSKALFQLGEIFLLGNGVEQNYAIALSYYELSAQYDNPDAFYILGDFYSNGDVPGNNIENYIYYIKKSVEYFMKSVNFHEKKKAIINKSENTYSEIIIYNNYFYHSYNDLGLIYITIFDDFEKGKEYIKEAAFGEYPFAQNNYGLLNELANNYVDAKYMYTKSSKNKFALAEYNLGHLKEINNEINDSIDYYINASEHEDVPLEFHFRCHYDKRLDISKTFIICYTNLKLSEYFMSNSKFEDSKKYFVKAFAKLNINTEKSKYQFKLNLKNKNKEYIFEYIKKYILNFPSFNLINQPNLSPYIKKTIISYGFDDINYQNDDETYYIKNISDFENNNKTKILGQAQNEQEIQNIDYFGRIDDNEDNFFDDAGKLFDFIIEKIAKNIFIKEIKKIITIMKEIIYTPPYNILFGRLYNIKPRPKKEINKCMKNITEEFYEGFGEDL